eukprot:1305572-Rhodomonas_salina.8
MRRRSSSGRASSCRQKCQLCLRKWPRCMREWPRCQRKWRLACGVMMSMMVSVGASAFPCLRVSSGHCKAESFARGKDRTSSSTTTCSCGWFSSDIAERSVRRETRAFSPIKSLRRTSGTEGGGGGGGEREREKEAEKETEKEQIVTCCILASSTAASASTMRHVRSGHSIVDA